PDGVYIVSQQWDIEYVNPVIEREFGPVDGRKCYEYFHNRTVTCPWCRNAEVFAGKSVRWEWHSFKNNRDYDLFDTPFRNADGSVSKFEIFHDITERKRAEREVREANTRLLAHKEQERQRVEAEVERLRSELVNKTRLAAIGQVSASIGHELRNPLGAIRNAVYLLRRKATDSQAKRTNYISMIEQEINRANQTITDLMEMARPKHPHQQDIDLGEAIRDATQRANIPEGVRLSIALEPDPFRTHADPSQMRQVLNNLITNAVQAVGNNGEISVDARRDSGYDEVQVRDTGPGVPEEDRERLFEPLFSTKAKGTGLGLTICRQIIERHGGTIEFVHPQGGNPAFLIRLPRRGTT
ncbi:MAG: hypothetical protein GY842_05975, partial [bacterium]|nr:hypothetical protein [bacterium]